MSISETRPENQTQIHNTDAQNLAPVVSLDRCPSLLGCRQLAAQLRPRRAELAARARCVGEINEPSSWATRMFDGDRRAMHDRSTSLRQLLRLDCREFGGCTAAGNTSGPVPIHYFGVFDGHGGSQISKFCADNMHRLIQEEWERLSPEEDAARWRERWTVALSGAFERADASFRGLPYTRCSGSTACVIVVSPCQIIAANCGDSRAILCRCKKVIPLTVDHKPENKLEAMRIEACGGRISAGAHPRVEGILSLTRAIGDHDMKRFVVSTPEVTFNERQDDDEFIVVASDGLWDVMTNKEVAKVVGKKLRQYRKNLTADPRHVLPALSAVNDLVAAAMKKGAKDNIVVTIVDLKRPSTANQ